MKTLTISFAAAAAVAGLHSTAMAGTLAHAQTGNWDGAVNTGGAPSQSSPLSNAVASTGSASLAGVTAYAYANDASGHQSTRVTAEGYTWGIAKSVIADDLLFSSAAAFSVDWTVSGNFALGANYVGGGTLGQAQLLFNGSSDARWSYTPASGIGLSDYPQEGTWTQLDATTWNYHRNVQLTSLQQISASTWKMSLSSTLVNVLPVGTAESVLDSRLKITVANGVQWTSASGRFLSLAAAVPEPATWAYMILGFGLLGAALRTRRAGAALAA